MSINNRVLIICAAIGAIGTIVAASLNGCFSKAAASTEENQTLSTPIKVSDSGSVNIQNVQLKQGDSSNSDIRLENIARDKIENNYYNAPRRETKSQPLSIDTGRKLNLDDINRLKSKIPKGYSISIVYPMNDKEAFNYATEIINQLESWGHKVETTIVVELRTPNPNPRFTIAEVNEHTKSVRMSVQA